MNHFKDAFKMHDFVKMLSPVISITHAVGCDDSCVRNPSEINVLVTHYKFQDRRVSSGSASTSALTT